MGVNNLGSVGKKWNFVHQFITANAVLARDSVSSGVRGAGLSENAVGDRHLPYVMEDCSTSNRVYMRDRPMARAMQIVNTVTRFECPSISWVLRPSASPKTSRMMWQDLSKEARAFLRR
jgi:hypothetical protein